MATPLKAIVFKSKYTIFEDDRLVLLSFKASLHGCWSSHINRCILVQSDVRLKADQE